MSPLVIVGCGKVKLDHPAPAFDLYTGTYFRAVLNYARSLSPDNRILILSGRYGLVRGSRVIEPYDAVMRRATRQVETVRAQARALGVHNEPHVVGLVSNDHGYARIVSAVWPAAVFPIPRQKMGLKQQWLVNQLKAS